MCSHVCDMCSNCVCVVCVNKRIRRDKTKREKEWEGGHFDIEFFAAWV